MSHRISFKKKSLLLGGLLLLVPGSAHAQQPPSGQGAQPQPTTPSTQPAGTANQTNPAGGDANGQGPNNTGTATGTAPQGDTGLP